MCFRTKEETETTSIKICWFSKNCRFLFNFGEHGTLVVNLFILLGSRICLRSEALVFDGSVAKDKGTHPRWSMYGVSTSTTKVVCKLKNG